MKHVLTGKCKTVFEWQNDKMLYRFLPKAVIHLIAYKWFNEKTKIPIDIQHWQDDGFDYAVTHPFTNEVYVSPFSANRRLKDFDKNLEMALTKANELYNKYN